MIASRVPVVVIQSRALHLLGKLGDTRLLLNEQARGAISWPFMVVLVFWLTMLFVGLGLFARRNATLVAALCPGVPACVGSGLWLAGGANHERLQHKIGIPAPGLAS